jgi:hypothetical protein
MNVGVDMQSTGIDQGSTIAIAFDCRIHQAVLDMQAGWAGQFDRFAAPWTM